LPQGIDIYFENVGGAVFDAALPLFNRNARIAVCGTVSEYNIVERAMGPDKLSGLLLAILGKRLTLRGFVIGDWFAKMPEFLAAAGPWVRGGKIKYREEIVEGLERAPAAFQAMLKAETFGKVIVKLGEPPR
jgi:NADPH-dependent curcumin reductase CurA